MDTKALLKKMGGQAKLAREFGITESAVSQWVSNDEIPKPWQKYLRLAHPGPHWDVYDEHKAQAVRSSAPTPQPNP